MLNIFANIFHLATRLVAEGFLAAADRGRELDGLLAADSFSRAFVSGMLRALLASGRIVLFNSAAATPLVGRP